MFKLFVKLKFFFVQDSRNFLRSPPVGVDFPFDFNLAYPVALATLEEDPNLKEMRFKLVPKQLAFSELQKNILT